MSYSLKSLMMSSSLLAIFFLPTDFNQVSARGGELYLRNNSSQTNASNTDANTYYNNPSTSNNMSSYNGSNSGYGHEGYSIDQPITYGHEGWHDNNQWSGSTHASEGNYGGPGYYNNSYPNYENSGYAPMPNGAYNSYPDDHGVGVGVDFHMR